MAKQSERHPKLLRTIVLGDGKCDIESLAAALRVSVKTARRDIESLRKLGIPIEDRNQEHGRKAYFLGPDALPFKLSYDEAFALLWCCNSMRPLHGTTWCESMEIATEKIRAAMGPVEKRYVEQMTPRLHQTQIGGDYRDRRDVIDALTLGIEDCRATFVTYHSASSTEPVTYDIHPYAIAEHRGTLYVVGFSCHHDEVRTWKVDRMLDAEATQVPFQRPKDFDAKQHFKGAFAVVAGAEPITVSIRFSGTAARYVQKKQMHASQQVVLRSGGAVDATFELTSTFEIKSWILSFGGSAEVLEPESLRQAIVGELHSAVGNYERSNARGEHA